MAKTSCQVGTVILANSKKASTVIIHGWTTKPDTWLPLVKWLAAVKIQAVVLKVPGLSAPLQKAWNLEDYVVWLNSKIDKLGQPVNIIAHSNGGRIALSFARQHPEKIAKLVLIDSAGLPRREMSLRIKRSVFKTLATLGKKVSSNPKLRKLLYKIARERDYLEASPVARQTMAHLLSSDDQFNTVDTISVNSLIIWGRQDKATPVKDAYVLGSILKPSRTHVIDDAGHSPHRTHTEAVGKSIADFIIGDV